MISRLVLSISFVLIALSAYGQGFSFQEYYSPAEYRAHVQNWDALKDQHGFIHFGNGNVVLSFDGINWNSIHIGETGRATSLNLYGDTVFVSGQNDFGYLISDSISSIGIRSLREEFYSNDEYFPPHFEIHKWKSEVFYRNLYGINKYEGENFTRFPWNEGILGASIQLKDSLLVGTDLGIISFSLGDDEAFRKVRGGEILAGDYLRFAKQVEPNKIIFGSFEHLLVSYDGDEFQFFETEADDYLREHQVYDFEKIDNDRYAISTLSGGVVFIDSKGKLLKILTERNGLATNQVYDLYLDDEKILWLGLQKGIQKILLDQNFRVFDEVYGINDIVTSFAISEDKVWVKTIYGVLIGEIIKPENTWAFKEVETAEDFTSFFVWKDQFYGIGQTGLYLLEGKNETLKIIDKPNLIKVKTANDSTLITLINQEELIRYDGAEILKDSIPNPGVFIDALQKGDSLFVLNQQEGVKIIVGDKIKSIPLEVTPDATTLYNEIGFINGEIFLAIEGRNNESSLLKFNKKSNHFTSDHFLSGIDALDVNQVFNFKQCSDSEIWFSANLKLIRVFKEESIWKADDSSYQVIKEVSAVETIFDYNCQPNSTWFGGTNGLVQLMNSEIEYETEFKTNITRLFIDRDSLIYGGFGPSQQDIILPYKNNELRFQYSAASYIDPQFNQYQIKLEGFDSNWSNWTSETQKDYTNIPEGEYTFRVRSKNAYEVAGMPAAISFEILPPWYRTWWAYLLYTLGITGILYTAYKIRVNQLLRVERIRNNIASDLHDEVSATLSSISYFAQAIESDKVQGDKSRFLKLISNSAGDAKEKITDIVWAINPEHDDWEGFLAKCRRYASDLLESKEMNYSLKIDEHIPGKLDMQLRQHLWLIFKEMMTNAVRHSEAKNIDVIMKYQHGKFSIVVQDDGKGMDVDRVKKGNGLVNIDKRADQIGADISLKTSEGFGTRWILSLAL